MGDYAASHVGLRFGEKYEKHIRSGFYSFVWEQLEKPMLARQLRDVQCSGRPALDLACGTGRITSHLAALGFAATGMDISDDMLAVARERHPEARFTRGDITRCAGQAQYALITAFRFFQNADSGMQRAALQYIGASLLADGMAIVNLHANPSSPYGMYHAIRRVLGLAAHRGTSLQDFLRLVPHTLVVQRIVPYAYFPRLLFAHRSVGRIALATERACSVLPEGLRRPLAQQTLLVMRRRA